MKVLKVSEVTSGIDTIINKKKEEKDHLLSIRDAMKKVIDLEDALKGEGGAAIRENFMIVHIPALLSFERFIDTYIQNLQEIKGIVQNYESAAGMVREDFIEQDVKNGINKVEQLTHEIAQNINRHVNTVNDLISPIPINLSQFDNSISDSKQHLQKTLEGLKQLDANSQTSLEPAANDLQKTQQLTGKIDGWSKNGVLLSKKEIQEVARSIDENTLGKIIEEYGLLNLLRNTTISFGAAIMNSGKLLKMGELSFKMFDKDGKVFIKIKNKNKELINLREYEKYRKLLQENIGGRWKWNRNFVNELVNKGVPLYDNDLLKRFKSNSNKFINSQFNDLSNYVKRLDDSFMKVAGTTFKNEMKIWESFKGWKDASKLTKLGKGAGVAGIGITIFNNFGSNFYNEDTAKWDYTGGSQVKKFTVDTTVDLGAGAAAMGVGAAAGSAFLPPAGTVVGAIVGAGTYAAINVKIPFLDPPQSVVDVTKNVANKAVDKVGEYASKAADEIGDAISSVGKKLDKIFW
ncbi:LXG domain-containing protein [Cytobacillus purgationiresistens]|uniref:LXG domain-containing protein n=1 Tax=Cytobacillus purgationiresistens TaxID=863449 RepID=A0ABU0ANX3_9BACI|nr:LXG domain-containing protein [Cytobacillus purgationiresistens]MDQ0272730.1 hypothetical protein [Cytobacillus purgationiresistens]